ncbi:hypothetical protein D3C85_1309840 [compost metagenome]
MRIFWCRIQPALLVGAGGKLDKLGGVRRMLRLCSILNNIATRLEDQIIAGDPGRNTIRPARDVSRQKKRTSQAFCPEIILSCRISTHFINIMSLFQRKDISMLP